MFMVVWHSAAQRGAVDLIRSSARGMVHVERPSLSIQGLRGSAESTTVGEMEYLTGEQ